MLVCQDFVGSEFEVTDCFTHEKIQIRRLFQEMKTIYIYVGKYVIKWPQSSLHADVAVVLNCKIHRYVLSFILKCEFNACKHLIILRLFGPYCVYCDLCIIKRFSHYLIRLVVLMLWNMRLVRIFWTSGLIVELHGLVFFQVILNNRF